MSTSLSRLSNQIEEPGAKAYHYLPATTTPLLVFRDPFATTPHTFPVVADSTGRFPAIYVPYGTYKERVTRASGVVLYENDQIPNPAPVTITSGASPPEQLFTTGDIKFRMANTSLSGFVRLNGRTIGSGASGATERANDDTNALFAALWAALANAEAAVSGGRGASAAADWAAGKTLTLPDWRRSGPLGLYDMGNTALTPNAKATVPSGKSTTPGAAIGAEVHTITTAELAAHGHTASSTVSDPGHAHTVPTGGAPASAAAGVIAAAAGGTTTGASTTGITVATTVNSNGSGEAHNNLPPAILGTWFIKL
jgi:hypothetical protein